MIPAVSSLLQARDRGEDLTGPFMRAEFALASADTAPMTREEYELIRWFKQWPIPVIERLHP